MKYKDLRDFITLLEQQGQLKRIPMEIDPYLEMTEIADRTLRAAANPGVDPIVLSVVDAGAGTGSPATDVTLALDPTFAGRTAGAALTLGVQISGGVAAAVPIYVQVHDSTHAIAVNTDLSLTMTLCEET